MEEKKGIFGGALGRMILPGIILQSVLIGGGYATGREIVEYGAKFGAMGWLSGLATFVGFALVAILSFELIRLYKVYDFKSFLKELIGPLYHVFDLVYLLFMVIIIAVMSSATGAVVEQMTGLNYWYGVGAITVIVGVLNYYGEKIISYFETNWHRASLHRLYFLLCAGHQPWGSPYFRGHGIRRSFLCARCHCGSCPLDRHSLHGL